MPMNDSILSPRAKPTLFKNEDNFDWAIREIATEFDVPFHLVKGMIAMESSFNPKAYRYEKHIKDASRGLMQILLRTAKAVGFKQEKEALFKPHTNIFYGVKHLKNLHRRYKDWPKAIVSYNMGSPVTAAKQTAYQAKLYGKAKPFWTFANEPYLIKVLNYSSFYEQREKERAKPRPDYKVSEEIRKQIKKMPSLAVKFDFKDKYKLIIVALICLGAIFVLKKMQ